jgi:phosphate transport system substrate-binding protein
VLSAIYLGEIKRWDDPQIQALNHGLRLPAVNIAPIYANGSGDTYVFTSYLSGVSSKWRTSVGTGATVSFPTGVGQRATRRSSPGAWSSARRSTSRRCRP